jgi:phosphoribosylformylglycinamidine cyclo-ligase
MTYKNSGVDIEEKEEAIKQLLSNFITKRKGTIGRPLGGHYAGLIEFGDYALVLCTDGVGTKVRVAEALKKYDTIGIDCIAMNVNDALCVGAEPLAFVDYLAMDDPNPKITKEIGKGLEKGAKLSNISIIGGETADLPELINGFDLAGTCLAYVEKNKIILGDKILPGDAIIGLSSSGIHSNGYTLARRVIEQAEFSYTDEFPDGLYPKKTIGEIMLTPTRIYVKEIIQLFKKIDVHGLTHITGSGLWNISRLKENVKYVVDDPFEPQPIFTFLQDFGNIDNYEMYQIFNMGMGFAVIIANEDVEETIKILQNYSEATVKHVGSIKKGTGVEVSHLRLLYR